MIVDEITVLQGLDGVRARPVMYVGDVTDPAALHHTWSRRSCSSFDEALGAMCTSIEVAVDRHGVVSVQDDGPGLPIAPDPREGVPACEVLLTRLHACRALRRDPRAARRFCGGGIAITTALSAWLEVEIDRDGRRHIQRFARGARETPLTDVGATDRHGTTIRFLPDPTIFGDMQVDLARLDATLDEIRPLVPATTVVRLAR